jgi:hypothetical protein
MGCFSHQLFHWNALLTLVSICCRTSHPSLLHMLVRNFPHWLDSWWKVFIISLLSLLCRMYNYCLLLLICLSFTAPKLSSCDLCMQTTQSGSVVTKTLLFHTYYSYAGSVIRWCTHNHTTYLVSYHGNKHICFNPTYCPWEQWLEIRSLCHLGNLVSST